jgi:hypothetical protein
VLVSGRAVIMPSFVDILDAAVALRLLLFGISRELGRNITVSDKQLVNGKQGKKEMPY